MKKGIKNKALVFSWFDGSFQCAVSLSTGLWQLVLVKKLLIILLIVQE